MTAEPDIRPPAPVSSVVRRQHSTSLGSLRLGSASVPKMARISISPSTYITWRTHAGDSVRHDGLLSVAWVG